MRTPKLSRAQATAHATLLGILVIGLAFAIVLSVATAYTNVAGPIGMPIIAVVSLIFLSLRRRSWTPLILIAAAGSGSLLLTIAGKDLIGRVRPPHTLRAPQGIHPARTLMMPAPSSAISTPDTHGALGHKSELGHSIWRNRFTQIPGLQSLTLSGSQPDSTWRVRRHRP